MSKIRGYPVSTEISKRTHKRMLPVERRRKINDYEARRLQRRAIANGGAASGCSTMITVALLGALAIVAGARKATR